MYRYMFRLPRTTNERRQFYASPFSLVRPARRQLNLPNAWDDDFGCCQRTWKVFGKKVRQHGYDQKTIREFKRGTEPDDTSGSVPLFRDFSFSRFNDTLLKHHFILGDTAQSECSARWCEFLCTARKKAQQ